MCVEIPTGKNQNKVCTCRITRLTYEIEISKGKHYAMAKIEKDDAHIDRLSEGKSVVHVRALTYCDIHTINVEKLKEVSTNKAKKNSNTFDVFLLLRF